MNAHKMIEKKITLILIMMFAGTIAFPSVFSLQHDPKENLVRDLFIHDGYNITVEIDDYFYYPGSAVTFHGRLTNNGTGFSGRIDFDLIDPHGNLCWGGMTHTDSNGNYSKTYTIAPTPVFGRYDFTVYYEEIPSVRASVSFEVIPSIKINTITGGIGKVHATIENTRAESLHNVSWTIIVSGVGGFFTFMDLQTNGTIDELKANETTSLKSRSFMLGLGGLEIWVIASINSEEYTVYTQGRIILCFILCDPPSLLS